MFKLSAHNNSGERHQCARPPASHAPAWGSTISGRGAFTVPVAQSVRSRRIHAPLVVIGE
jgi:hypothetical protein